MDRLESDEEVDLKDVVRALPEIRPKNSGMACDRTPGTRPEKGPVGRPGRTIRHTTTATTRLAGKIAVEGDVLGYLTSFALYLWLIIASMSNAAWSLSL